MITERLESLIWNKKAKYKTWTIGTGAAQLKVPTNRTVIILGFDYFPFIDSAETNFNQADEWLKRTNHQIIISDKNSRLVFLARDYYQRREGVRPGSHFFKMYAPFTESVFLNIVNIISVENWSIVDGNAPTKSEQKAVPLGYGTIDTPTEQTPIRLYPGSILDSEIRPFFDTRPSRAVSFNDFQVPVDIDTKLNNPDLTDAVGNVQFPMVTVHYVEINERLTDTFL